MLSFFKRLFCECFLTNKKNLEREFKGYEISSEPPRNISIQSQFVLHNAPDPPPLPLRGLFRGREEQEQEEREDTTRRRLPARGRDRVQAME